MDENLDPQLLASTPTSPVDTRATTAASLVCCDDEEVLGAAKAWFSASTAPSPHDAKPDVLVLVARHSGNEGLHSADPCEEQLDHLMELFEDWRRRVDDDREWISIDRRDHFSFPDTAEILQHLLDGKRVVFLLTLGLRTAKSMFLGEFASYTRGPRTASGPEMSVIQLLDALQSSPSNRRFAVRICASGFDMLTTNPCTWSYMSSQWRSLDTCIHFRLDPWYQVRLLT